MTNVYLVRACTLSLLGDILRPILYFGTGMQLAAFDPLQDTTIKAIKAPVMPSPHHIINTLGRSLHSNGSYLYFKNSTTYSLWPTSHDTQNSTLNHSHHCNEVCLCMAWHGILSTIVSDIGPKYNFDLASILAQLQFEPGFYYNYLIFSLIPSSSLI